MFPYDSTLDQQYDQPQFESYRHLGYVAGRAMCLKASTWPKQAGEPPEGWPQPLASRFQALRYEFAQSPVALGDIAQALEGIRAELARNGGVGSGNGAENGAGSGAGNGTETVI